MQKTIYVNDQPLTYSIEGNGDAVVLVHGLAEDHTVWQQQTRFLSAHYRVIVPDLPGSGGSALLAHTSMESLANAVKTVLDAEIIPQAVLIGHSMGGYVTLAFAEKFPGSLKAFGLFNSTAYADSDDKKAARTRNIDFIGTHGTHEFLKQATPGLFSQDTKAASSAMVEELIERYRNFSPLSLMAYNQAMMDRPDRTAMLAQLNGPVLFVMGKQDAGIPLQQSLEQAYLADIEYICVLERSGHMGFIEEPDRSNAQLKKFLDDAYMS